jgi:hypothetical protein
MHSDQTKGSTKQRSPILAVVLSGFFPGLGQLYNRQPLKALLFFGGGVVTGFGPFSALDIDIDLSNPAPGMQKMLLATLPFLAIALWSVYDAYRTARGSRG